MFTYLLFIDCVWLLLSLTWILRFWEWFWTLSKQSIQVLCLVFNSFHNIILLSMYQVIKY
jgi:hypothetical protein